MTGLSPLPVRNFWSSRFYAPSEPPSSHFGDCGNPRLYKNMRLDRRMTLS